MNEGYVICPYFSGQSEKRIRCEGVIQKTKITTEFENKEKKIEYMKKRCRSFDYEKCEYAKKREDEIK